MPAGWGMYDTYSIVYKATVTSTNRELKAYIGMTESTFKFLGLVMRGDRSIQIASALPSVNVLAL